MHTGSTAHLGDAADALFNVLRRNEHEVCKLVDDNDDARHLRLLVFGKVLVICLKASYAKLGEQPVSLQHLRNRPLERTGGLLRVGDNRYIQVRNAVINAKLDHFGVDHDELDLIGVGFIQKAYYKRVHAHRFARAGSACNEQVRKLCDVADYRLTGNVLADGKAEL